MRRRSQIRRELPLSTGGALLFLACATAIVPLSQLSDYQRERIQTTRFGADDSLIYSAVLGFYADKGYSFQVADKTSGLIQTEPLMYPANEDRDRLSTALVGVKFRYRRRVTARIKDGTVRLSYVFESEDKGRYFGESGWEVTEPDTSFSNRAYREAFSGITAFLAQGK